MNDVSHGRGSGQREGEEMRGEVGSHRSEDLRVPSAFTPRSLSLLATFPQVSRLWQ
jgi:hypothetical protein